MIAGVELKDFLHKKGLSRKQQALFCLAADPLKARTVAELRELAVDGGLRSARKWNLSNVLGSLAGLAIRSSEGWELTEAGKAEVQRLIGTPTIPAKSSLRTALARISSADTRAFLEEAIGCAEARHYRAAVVLAWVGAVAVLYEYVIASCLSALNAEATKRDARWKPAKNADDLSRMKEYDFLQILEAISVIGKNVKTELETCLKLRNACGHPNSLALGEHRVNSHLETLALNVFARFT